MKCFTTYTTEIKQLSFVSSKAPKFNLDIIMAEISQSRKTVLDKESGNAWGYNFLLCILPFPYSDWFCWPVEEWVLPLTGRKMKTKMQKCKRYIHPRCCRVHQGWQELSLDLWRWAVSTVVSGSFAPGNSQPEPHFLQTSGWWWPTQPPSDSWNHPAKVHSITGIAEYLQKLMRQVKSGRRLKEPPTSYMWCIKSS